MRTLVFFMCSAVTSTAFQVSLTLWPDRFQVFAPYVKWMWVASVILFLWWLLTHPKVLRFLGYVSNQSQSAASQPSTNITNTVSPVFNINANAGKAESVPSPVRDEQPNLQLESAGYAPVILDDDDAWTANPRDPNRHLYRCRAMIARIIYAPSDSGGVADCYVRALLRVNGISYSPLPWLDEVYNSVELSPATQKDVILAVQLNPAGIWKFVVNRRHGTDYDRTPSAMEFSDIPIRDTKAELKLIDADSGRILLTLPFDWIYSPEPHFRLRGEAM